MSQGQQGLSSNLSGGVSICNPSEEPRIFAVGLALRGAIVGAIAPLLLFFSCVGSPYGFLVVAGLVAFGIAEAGLLRTIDQGVRILRQHSEQGLSVGMTRLWMAVYMVVAMQLTWSLRPIIRHPSVEEFTLFGGPGGNMFTYFLQYVIG